MERHDSSASDATESQYRTAEQGTNPIQQGQQSIVEAIQLPVRQAVDLQRDMARIFLNGLELTESTQRMGIDLTRSLSRSYLDAIQNTMNGPSQAGQGNGAPAQGQPRPPNGGGQVRQANPVGQAPRAPAGTPASAATGRTPGHDYRQQYQSQPPLRYEQGTAPPENQMPPQQYPNQPPE